MFTFFVVNIWLVGMCISSEDPDLNANGTLGSPFVIAIKRADVYGLAHAINGFIFLSVISCGITSVYVASRSLTALADMHIIHPFFGRKDAQGRPYVALVVSLGLGGGLCYLNVNSVGVIVYGWFSALVSVSSKVRLAAATDLNRLQSQHCSSGPRAILPTFDFDKVCERRAKISTPSPSKGS